MKVELKNFEDNLWALVRLIKACYSQRLQLMVLLEIGTATFSTGKLLVIYKESYIQRGPNQKEHEQIKILYDYKLYPCWFITV